MEASRRARQVVEVVPVDVHTVRSAGMGAHAQAGDRPRASVFTGEVGDLHPGDAGSRWLLARYLVARTLGDNAVRALLVIAVLAAALTLVLAAASAPTVLTVLVGLLTLGWFVAWRLARAVWTRLAAPAALDPVAPQLRRLVGDTRPAVRRELRRVGLSAHPFAAFALAPRLVGARRPATVARLRRFDVERVVPPGRVDEIEVLLARARTATPGRR